MLKFGTSSFHALDTQTMLESRLVNSDRSNVNIINFMHKKTKCKDISKIYRRKINNFFKRKVNNKPQIGSVLSFIQSTKTKIEHSMTGEIY